VTFARPTYWLSMHVPYVCQHAGVCCSSRWPIPVERARVSTVQLLRRDGSWLRAVEGEPADVAGVLAVSDSGQCVFHDQGCEIHRAFGSGALPSACQHFPRQVLIDPRGVFVTLSHYCPTAADLLFSHRGPVVIVEGPPALAEGEVEGIDARDVLPPVLVAGGRTMSRAVGPSRAGSGEVARVGTRSRGARHPAVAFSPPIRNAVLMDFEACSAWDAHVVSVLTTSDCRAEEALTHLDDDLRTIQQWRPGQHPLSSAIVALPRRLQARRRGDAAADPDVVVGRYLAARGFASAMAYQRDGVAAVLRGLRHILQRLRQLQQRHPLKEAIRQTDWEAMHSTGAARDLV
jgi:hypothetical protein